MRVRPGIFARNTGNEGLSILESPKDKMLLRLVWGHFCLLSRKDKAQRKGELGDDNPLSLCMQICLKLAYESISHSVVFGSLRSPGQ